MSRLLNTDVSGEQLKQKEEEGGGGGQKGQQLA